MGQKANPIGLRVGYIVDWKSRWFSSRNFREVLKQDHELRMMVKKKLKEAALTSIEIVRSSREVAITVHSPRPGVIIGRGGTGVEELKKEIAKKVVAQTGKKIDVKLNIEEVRDPNGNAAVIARGIAEQLEKRMPFRRAIKQALERAKETAGVRGIRVVLAGRLNAADMARKETISQGNVPLHTLRANIDFARDTARTNVGAVGIKVWVYKGELFKQQSKDNVTSNEVPGEKARPRFRRRPEVVRPKTK